MDNNELNRYKQRVPGSMAGSFDFSGESAKEFFMRDGEIEYPEDSNPELNRWIQSLENINFENTLLQNRAIDFVPGLVARRYGIMPVKFIGNNALAIAVSEELKVSGVLDDVDSLQYVLKHPVIAKYKASSAHIKKTIQFYYDIPDTRKPAINTECLLSDVFDDKPKITA